MTHWLAMSGMLLLHALFVVSEYAFVKANNDCVKLGSKAAKLRSTNDILCHLESYLRACQIGKTVALMIIGVLLGLVLGRNFGNPTIELTKWDIGLLCVGFLLIVLVQVVIGFELPKLVGILKNDQCVSKLSGFLRVSRFLLSPMAWLVNQLVIRRSASHYSD